MLPTAKEEMLSPLAPSSTWSAGEIFFFAAGVAFTALETHQGTRRAQGKKLHHGVCRTNRALRIGEIQAKWSGTHQDSETSWRKTASGSALDANGNTLGDAQGRTYTWDFETRLVQAVVPGTNGGITTFKYDPFGRRIQKSGPLGTTNYLYDGPSLLAELDNLGDTVAEYAQGMNEDEHLSQIRSSTTSYYEQDSLTSVTSLSGQNGGLATSYGYDSFGNLISSSGALVNFYRYTGRDFDLETRIHYYRARYYDPASGRFVSADPFGLNGGVNFYEYVLNRPVNAIDPLGLKCTTTLMLVTAYCANSQPTKSGKWPSDGSVAVANTRPQPYPMGCTVRVSGPLRDPVFDPRPLDPFIEPSYLGIVEDTGAGWNLSHHHVEPDTWIDIWIHSCSKAIQWGMQWRKVTICCKDCK